MNTDELHRIAERLARQRGISHGCACAILSKAGTTKRRQLAAERAIARAKREHPPVQWWQKELYE